MQVNGNLDGGFELRDKILSDIWLQQSRHILDTDGMASHLFEFDRQLNEHFVGVHRADRVYETALDMRLFGTFERGADRHFQVANVVERIEDTEDADTACRGFLNELFYNIVGIMIIAEQVLTAQEHLDRGLEVLLQSVQTFPRIFIKETQARIKCCSAPSFKGVVPDGIKRLKLRKHIRNSHAGCKQ